MAVSFDLQVFAPQMAGAAGLAAACPDVTFILQHAGMLEDLSPEGRAAWRGGMMRLAACPNVVSKAFRPRHLHPPQRPGAHIRDRRATRSAIFGAERCLFGSNFPIEKLWTSYRELVDAYRAAISAS